MGLDDVPYYCRLCQFRCFNVAELHNHIIGFPRHALLLREKDVTDEPGMLVTNPAPYRVSEKDILQLTEEESRQHWKARQTKVSSGGSTPLQEPRTSWMRPYLRCSQKGFPTLDLRK